MATFEWKPARSLAECDYSFFILWMLWLIRLLFTGEAILTAPGALHELEHAIINNRIYRVYKNLWPSLRAFWIDRITQNTEIHNQEYLVFEDTRITYGQADKIIHKLASILYEASVFFFCRVLKAHWGLLSKAYGIRKGDRVGISMRNYPEWILIFWAVGLVVSTWVAYFVCVCL